MKIERIEESRELCSEAGWCAYDIMLGEPIQEHLILELGKMGDLCYLRKLNPPFFKIESEDRMLKGLEGAKEFRASMPSAHEKEILRAIISEIEKCTQA